MYRSVWVGFCLLTVIACRLPPDRAPLQPLPEDGQAYSYREIISRARLQATMAMEAFYVDAWGDLEEVAQGLELTARYLPKASNPPEKSKDKLPDDAKLLAKDCFRLRVAAQGKNVKDANEVLQSINFKIRSLGAEAPIPPKKDAPPPAKIKIED